MTLLEADALGIKVDSRTIVESLRWRVLPGQRWCVIGRNAAGKTTLLRALAGLAVSSRTGSIRWMSRDQHQWSAADAATLRAYMPQQSSDRFPTRVRTLLELSRVTPGRDLDDLAAGLDIVGLLDRDVTRLSGGERQRVALGQCAVQGAPLMLLDEPVSFQDPGHQVQIADWLVGSSKVGAVAEAGCAIVFSAHDVNWIARVATHVLALTGEGSWTAGPAGQMMTPASLERVYGCRWEVVGGRFLVAS